MGFLLLHVMRFGVASPRSIPGRRPWGEGGKRGSTAIAISGRGCPAIVEVLEQVQIDHTVVDLIVVDEQHRLPIGRPYVTVAIDVRHGASWGW